MMMMYANMLSVAADRLRAYMQTEQEHWEMRSAEFETCNETQQAQIAALEARNAMFEVANAELEGAVRARTGCHK
jgi:DNA-binding ferritin-like protein